MKRFTVESANRALPLVRRIVDDIVKGYATWQEHVRALEVIAGDLQSASRADERIALEKEAARLAAEVQGFLDELTQLGVEFKGFDVGLVDFPCEMGGRTVYLCWRLGESAVSYWHETDAGFAGRQPLSPRAVA